METLSVEDYKKVRLNAVNELEKYVASLEQNEKPFLCKIPDNQIALMFLDQAMGLLKEKGLLCLIMPSGPMLESQEDFVVPSQPPR